MEIQKIGIHGEHTIKKAIINRILNLNIAIGPEADYFIGIIANNAENKVSKIERSSGRKIRFKNYSLGKGITVTIKRQKMNLELEEAIKRFSNELITNSVNNKITTRSIYVTMMSICPLWPFC